MPRLRPDQIVVVPDNLDADKGERACWLVEGGRCGLLFLPPYSPDLSTIGRALRAKKTPLRGRRVPSRDYPAAAIGATIDAIIPADTAASSPAAAFPVVPTVAKGGLGTGRR